MNINKLSIIVIPFAMIAGCSKDSSKTKVAGICLLTSMNTGATSTTFHYNDNNQIVSETVGSGTPKAFTYDAKGNIIMITYGTGNVSYYTYDVDNNLTQEYRTLSGANAYQMTYQYNATGQMTSFTYNSPGPPAVTFSSQLQYPNTSTKNPSGLSSSGLLENFEYDDKPNPRKFMFPSITSENNVTKSTTSNSSGTPTIVTFSYQYNTNGYPVLRTASNGTSTTFDYDCK